MFIYQSWIVLERAAKESDSLVGELINKIIIVHPSNMEHVKFRVNLPRPLGKAKYYLDDR